MKRVVVVGGGPSGLVLGYELLVRGAGALDPLVVEAQRRPGGKAWTEPTAGYLVEHGPEGFLDSAPATLTLARELGLGDRLLPADPRAARRYLWARGRLRPVPTNPGAFLASGILSLTGRLAVLGEDIVDGLPGTRFDHVVCVQKCKMQGISRHPTDAGLAGAHEPDEGKVVDVARSSHIILLAHSRLFGTQFLGMFATPPGTETGRAEVSRARHSVRAVVPCG